jgi:hypothetical protein
MGDWISFRNSGNMGYEGWFGNSVGKQREHKLSNFIFDTFEETKRRL